MEGNGCDPQWVPFNPPSGGGLVESGMVGGLVT